MPTSYTNDVGEKNISFREFALTCARAFGPAIMQRDDPHGPVKLQTANTSYYEEVLAETKEHLAAVTMMTIEDAEKASRADWEAEQKHIAERLQEIYVIRQRHEAMLTQVNAWIPPTEEHVHFKEFMQEQLNISLRYDCNEGYYNNLAAEPIISGEEWLKNTKEKAEHDVKYYTEQIAKEIERTNSRNEWISALMKSV